MNNETSILDEFVIKKNKPKSWGLITVLASLYVTLLLIEFIKVFSRASPNTFDLQMAMLFFLFPCAGLAFHIFRKKAGWIIQLLYYSFITIVSGHRLITHLQRIQYTVTDHNNWKQPLIFLITITLTLLLLLNSTRKFFNISILSAIVCLTITITFSLVLIFLMLKR